MRKQAVLTLGILFGLLFPAAGPGALAADIVLKYGDFGSGKTPFVTMASQPWREKVGELSGGKVEVKSFLNSLGGARELYKNTRDGIADIGWVTASAQQGFSFPRSEVLTLPNILDGYSNVAANVALWRLYEKGLIKADYSDVVPLAFASMSPAHLMTRGVEPTIDQLKGMKFAVTGGISAQIMQTLGAIPVFTSVTDLYQAMSRKTVDGIMVGFTAVKAFKLDEVTDRHTVIPMDSPLVFIGMNKKKLDSLPADARKAVLDASGIPFSRMFGRAADAMVGFNRKALGAAPDQKLIEVPEAEKEKWRAAIKPVIDHWVNSTPNGAEILAAYKSELLAAKQDK